MNRVKVQGSALLFVLVMMFIVMLLANVILQIMLNQGRLSQHRIWRAQALYAAKAGMVLAMEQLRRGNWHFGDSACINCAGGMTYPPVVDPGIPYQVNIVIRNPNDSPVANPAAPTLANSAPIEITVSYQHAGVF